MTPPHPARASPPRTMTPPAAMRPSQGTASGELGITNTCPARDRANSTSSPDTATGEIATTNGNPARNPVQYNPDLEPTLCDWHTLFDSVPPARQTGQMWNLIFHCKGAEPEKEFLQIEIDRADISFFNLMCLKSKFGYSGRDYLYYKNRSGSGVATLQLVDYEDDAQSMIQNNERERKIRFLLTKDQPSELQVSITPMKRPRESRNHDEPCAYEQIDAYKVWLASLQNDANEEDEQPESEYKDDYRVDTIRTYTEWLRQRHELSNIVSYLQQDTDDEDQESSALPKEWPSHARLPKKKVKGDDKNHGRGTLKGFSAATKRVKSGTQKLKIQFSKKLGGPVGPNARAFVDEVVTFTRKRAPLIGVRSWKDIKQNVKNSIASDVLSKWDFEDPENAKEKIWEIASERYKGWRSSLSSTYKAYNSYHERMKRLPEDVDIVEWHYLMLYFGSEKFQKVSRSNSRNRQCQRTRHLMGSKTFSRVSHENRDEETGEEPGDLNLFEMTHSKCGVWSNAASMEVYEHATSKIFEKEAQSDRLLSTEEENIVFQSVYKDTTGCKTSRLHGHGYMAKYPSRRQLMNAQIEEQARASAAAQQKNIELENKVQHLEEQLAERDRLQDERTRQMREEEEKAREALRESLREEFREEMRSLLAKQREEALQQADIESNVPTEQAQIRKTRSSIVNPNNNVSANYISSQQLRNAASKSRARTRSGKDDTI